MSASIFSPAASGRLWFNQRLLRPELELRPDDDLDPEDDRDRPLEDDLLTLRPPEERPTLRDLDEERETLRDRDEERDDLETLPGDREDRDDRETSRDDLEDDREDDLDASPDDPDDLEDDPDTLPDDLELDSDPRVTLEPDEPVRELRPEEVSPLLLSTGLFEIVGYHSTPLRLRVVERVVVRVPLDVPEDLVVERVPEREILERSSVRPPSEYLSRGTVAVRVLTRVEERVVLSTTERVVLRVRLDVRGSELETVPEVPEVPRVTLRPTSTFPSSGSESLVVERARSYPRVLTPMPDDPYPVLRPSELRRP